MHNSTFRAETYLELSGSNTHGKTKKKPQLRCKSDVKLFVALFQSLNWPLTASRTSKKLNGNVSSDKEKLS